MVHWVFLLFLACLFGFIIYRLLNKNEIKVDCNPDSVMVQYLNKMKTLKKGYSPTPWLFNPHFQTVWGMKFRKKPHGPNPRREPISFEDGGNAILDWFETDSMDSTTPIIVISHTLAGGTREPVVTNFAITCVKHGWRAVVGNHRGCSGAKVTSRRLFNAIEVDDLHNVVLHVRKKFQPSSLFIVGFSLGACQGVQYSAQLADPSNVDAICCISHPYHINHSMAHLRDWPQRILYTPVIISKFHRIAEKARPFYPSELVDAAQKAKFINDFDDIFTSEMLHLKGKSEEYYSKACCYQFLPHSKVPTLLMSADDDPFAFKSDIPYQEVNGCKNLALIHTAEGGHVSFVSGMNGTHSLIDDVIPDFIQAFLDSKKN